MTPEQAKQLQDIWNVLFAADGQGPPELGGANLVSAAGTLLTQLTGTDPGKFNGWPQTGGRTDTDLIAAAAAKLGVPGAFDTKSTSSDSKSSGVLASLKSLVRRQNS